MADVDESARSNEPRSELADIDVALLVHFSGPKECHVQAASIVKIELVRLVDQGNHVGPRAKVYSRVGKPAYDAGFGQ